MTSLLPIKITKKGLDVALLYVVLVVWVLSGQIPKIFPSYALWIPNIPTASPLLSAFAIGLTSLSLLLLVNSSSTCKKRSVSFFR